MRHGARHAFDVAGQWGVVFNVIGGMLAHDVDDARSGLFGIVQIGQTVTQTRPQVEQCAGWFVCHAVVTIRGTGDDAFKEAQHTAHAIDLVQGGHKMHLGCPGIGQTHLDALADQGARQTFCSVHGGCLLQASIGRTKLAMSRGYRQFVTPQAQ